MITIENDTDLVGLQNVCAQQAAVISALMVKVIGFDTVDPNNLNKPKQFPVSIAYETLNRLEVKFCELPPLVKEKAIQFRKEWFGIK